MKNITFSLYQNKKDIQTQVITKPWNEWIKILTNHTIIGSTKDTNNEDVLNQKKNHRAIILGTVKGRRIDSNVVDIQALSLDLDSSTEEEIHNILDKLNSFEYVGYTTHKHGSLVAKGVPRIRIILPLKEPIEPKDFLEAWRRLNHLIGGHNDESTKNVGRLNFLPSTFDKSLVESRHNKGAWLTLNDLPKIELDRIVTKEAIQLEVDKLVRVLNTMRKTHDLKKSVKALTAGEVFAEEGTRHNTIVALTIWLAWKVPNASKQAIKELFRLSLEKMKVPERAEEIWTAYDGALKKVKASQRKKQLNGTTPYTDEQLQTIADRQKCTVTELQKRWIIQKDGCGWVLGNDGHYRGVFSRFDLEKAIFETLPPAPINLYTITQSGFQRRKTNDLVIDYGTLAERIISDLSAEYSLFIPSNRMMKEAVISVRLDLVSKFYPEIDKWLQLFGGTYYPKLIDYLSAVPDLSKPLCALYFDGVRGTGKTQFAHGLAKIWSYGSPVKLSQVLSGFNEALSQCPIIFADEKLPRKSKFDTITEDLRALVGSSDRELTRKYKTDSSLNGQIRLILAANNENLLESAQINSKADLEAIAQRFLYIKVGDKAQKYLEDIDFKTKKKWWDYKFAQHVLWLSKNHEIKVLGHRFVVDGDETEMHRMLLTGGFWNRLVCEWMVRYLNEPHTYDVLGHGYARIYQKELLINEQAIVDNMEVYLKTKKIDPDTVKIGEALRAFTVDVRKKKQLRWKKIHIRYHVIDIGPLLGWSERYNIGSKEQMLQNLGIIKPTFENNQEVIDLSERLESGRDDEKNGETFNLY